MSAAEFEVGSIRLSGLNVRPQGRPRGLVVALPGAGYLAGYWNAPGASLLEMAARRGYRALAIDRPGYGASEAQSCDLARQADIVLDLVETLKQQEGGAPVLLAGHSLGGILGLMIGAHPRASLLSAIDVCGVPLAFPEQILEAMATLRPTPGQTHYPVAGREQNRQRFFGADGTFEPQVLDYDAEISAPVPLAELPDAATAPETLPRLMPRITLPVRFSFAEFEASSIVDAAMAERARTMLSGSEQSEVLIQQGSGHNISLHHVGAAFHRDMLDWFESVLV